MRNRFPTTLEIANATDALGPRHAMTRALQCRRIACHHLGFVGLALVTGALGLAVGAPWSLALIAGAATVFAGLLVFLSGSEWQTRRVAVELIAQGRENLDVASIALQRARLLDRRHREHLARTLEGYVREAINPSRRPLPASRPFADPTTIREVRSELLQLARLIRAGSEEAIGVARAEVFITNGVLIFEAGDPEELRRQLRRAISALQRTDPAVARQPPTTIRRSAAEIR